MAKTVSRCVYDASSGCHVAPAIMRTPECVMQPAYTCQYIVFLLLLLERRPPLLLHASPS